MAPALVGTHRRLRRVDSRVQCDVPPAGPHRRRAQQRRRHHRQNLPRAPACRRHHEPREAHRLDCRGPPHVEPIQHRFRVRRRRSAGPVGVDPASIVAAARLQDAYFQGGSASQLMATLAASHRQHPRLGRDRARLPAAAGRPHDAAAPGRRHQAVRRNVTFHYAGVAKEFPTAPRDSFLIANAAYITTMTGSDTVGAFLVDTGGQHITDIAEHLHAQVGPAERHRPRHDPQGRRLEPHSGRPRRAHPRRTGTRSR